MINRFQKKGQLNKVTAMGLLILGLMIVMALLVPLISPYGYETQNASMANLGSSLAHPFGTDKFGRDIFVRVWYGARISLLVGFVSAAVNLILGVLAGAAAGYIGGTVDTVLMGIANMISAIPSLLYVILIMLVGGNHIRSILIGICISGWIGTARIVRGEVRSLKEMEFVMAARVSGIGEGRILLKHLLPNAWRPVFVNATFLVPQAIFTEAFLSFVGIGIAAPMASLGTLINEARSQMQLYPSQMICPILVLCIIIGALHMVGGGLEHKIGKQ